MKAVSKSVSTRFALGIFAVAVIASECKSGILAEFGEPDETEHLGAYQYADAVGVGRVVGYGTDYLTINISQYWFGNLATNPVSIYEAFNRWTDGIDRRNSSYFEDKNIVFFATTNHVKQAVPARPKGEFLILESSIGFTNYYGYCAPKRVLVTVCIPLPLVLESIRHLLIKESPCTNLYAPSFSPLSFRSCLPPLGGLIPPQW